jgi:hypothetical protein
MKTNPYIVQWYRAEIYFFAVSAVVLLSITALGILFWFVLPSVPLVILIMVISVVVLVGLVTDFKQRKGQLMKLFFVRPEAAIEVIEGVLGQKGVPFQEINRRYLWSATKIYQLDNGLTVNVRRNYKQGVIVEVGPISKDNRPLIRNLQAKIDDAFAPRGLL